MNTPVIAVALAACAKRLLKAILPDAVGGREVGRNGSDGEPNELERACPYRKCYPVGQ